MSFFQSNPFSTSVGQRIERATDSSLASEDWGLNMEICDIINETDEGPKDGMKAIRKRLQQSVGKNYTTVMYTLTVLETCVKNCGHRFHVLVMTKDFINDLVKIIGPKNDPPTAVQEKVLSLIQAWADAFRGSPDMNGVVQIYTDLKNKGIEFPMTDLDSLAPIHTPQRTVNESESLATRPPPHVHAEQMQGPPSTERRPVASHGSPVARPAPVQAGPYNLTPEQTSKLRSEMDVVMGNVRVLGEMLTELQPSRVEPADLELLQELHGTCKAMQGRIVDLIDRIANDEITGELLHVNDDLNNAFLRYERFERYRAGLAAQSAGQSPPSTVQQSSAPAFTPPPTFTEATTAPRLQPPPQPQQQSAAESDTLIDFGSDSPEPTQQNNVNASLAAATQQLADLDFDPFLPSAQAEPVYDNNEPVYDRADPAWCMVEGMTESDVSEFDMFAQARQTTYEQSRQGGSTYEDNSNVNQYSVSLGTAVGTRHAPNRPKEKEQDYEEMEKWLKENSDNANPQEPVTSAEFDQFLASRAVAAEELPSISAATGQRSNRQIQQEEAENSLFAL